MTRPGGNGPRAGRPARRLGRPPAGFSARDQILRGATEVFGALGYARTSVEAILEGAGVSRRTFYQHFDNKDEVFDLLMSRSLDKALAAIEEAIDAAPTAMAKLEAGVEAYLRVIQRVGPLARTLLLDSFPPGSQLARRREAARERYIELIARHDRGVRRRRVDPMLIRGLAAGLDHVAVLLALQAGTGELDIERGKRVMFRMLAAALAEPEDAVPPLPLEPGPAAAGGRSRRR